MKLIHHAEREIDHAATGLSVSTERSLRGLTQAALASAMRITSPYLCDLEYGRRNWTPALYAKAKAGIIAHMMGAAK